MFCARSIYNYRFVVVLGFWGTLVSLGFFLVLKSPQLCSSKSLFYAAWIILCYVFNSFVCVSLAAPSPPNTLDVYVCLFFMISSCPPTTELQTWTTATTFMVWFELQYRDRDRRFCVAADRTKWFGDLGLFFEPISPHLFISLIADIPSVHQVIYFHVSDVRRHMSSSSWSVIILKVSDLEKFSDNCCCATRSASSCSTRYTSCREPGK